MQKLQIDPQNNVYALVCPNLTNLVINKLVNVSPLNLLEPNKRKFLFNDILIAYEIKLNDAKVVGMYSPKNKKFIVNLGIKDLIDNNCKLKDDEDKNDWKLMSMAIVHELIHHLFVIRFDRNLIEPISLKFYKTVWKSILKDNVDEQDLNIIVKLNYTVAIQKKLYTTIKQDPNMNFEKMLSYMEQDGLFKNLDNESINILKEISEGHIEVKLNNLIKDSFENGYKEIYKTIPFNTKYGQEFINGSEIFSVAAQTDSDEARKVVKHILDSI